MLQISLQRDFKRKVENVISDIYIFRSKSFPKNRGYLDTIPAGTIQSSCKYQTALSGPT